MKYVMFKYKAGVYMPVIHPDHVTHSQISIADAKPVSAGFLEVGVLGQVKKVYGRSESLNLEPHPGDKGLLEAALMDCGTSSFIDMDRED